MISVAVFIDLLWRPEAGGHVKSWERFAEAAVSLGDQLDLTLHFLGEREQRIELSPRVRYVTHAPIFSTKRLRFVEEIVDHTDLAPLNPRLLRGLNGYDVLHSTHPLFTFGKTALYYAKRRGTPLVSSVHTDVPRYAQIYTEQLLRRLFGQRHLGALLVDRWQLHRRRAMSMARALERYWRQCAHVIVSQQDDFQRVARIVSESRISYLRRGIDKDLFSPERSDRARLASRYGIPEDRLVLLFVGRVDPCKNVMTYARAVRRLLDMELPVHALVVGEGNSIDAVQSLLGESVTLPGVQALEDLAWLYASADVFVFPSDTETYGNVVVEAKAAGLPVMVAGRGGASQLVQTPGVDGIVIDDIRPQAWADAIASLVANRQALADMGKAARSQVASAWPSWQEVLEQDLLPVWRLVAESRSSAAGAVRPA